MLSCATGAYVPRDETTAFTAENTENAEDDKSTTQRVHYSSSGGSAFERAFLRVLCDLRGKIALAEPSVANQLKLEIETWIPAFAEMTNQI
ncbi:hypothetical protein BH09GEM1_BH09GEM1_33100 [soil metagenome]